MNPKHQRIFSKYKPSKSITKKICYALANWLYRQESTFTHRDRFIFYFVFQTVIYQVFDTIILLLIGILLHKLLITLCVISAFIYARSKHRGYHAKSILACGVFSIGAISFCIISAQNIFLGALFGYVLGYVIGIEKVKGIMRKTEDKLFNRR
jgi:accessory gene regulator protein AgrB